MKRVDHVKAQLIDTKAGTWRLDPHSADYVNLSKRSFTTVPYVIPQHEEHRPDRIAISCYGNPSMWWVLLVAFNGMVNALAETTAGTVINVPDISELDAYFKRARAQARTGDLVVL